WNLVGDERNDARLLRRGPDQPNARNLTQLLGHIYQQLMLISGDVFHTDPFKVVRRRAKPDRGTKCRGTGLETRGRIGERTVLKSNALDHIAAALPRRHLVEQRLFAVNHTDRARTEHLV